jgi:hypothetical protein
MTPKWQKAKSSFTVARTHTEEKTGRKWFAFEGLITKQVFVIQQVAASTAVKLFEILIISCCAIFMCSEREGGKGRESRQFEWIVAGILLRDDEKVKEDDKTCKLLNPFSIPFAFSSIFS